MIDAGFEILNQRGTPMFFSDTFANRPAAGIVGRIFISTDTNEIYRDTGTGWNLIGGPGSGTITGSIAANQVAFGTSSGVIGGSSNFLWSNSQESLALGTSGQSIFPINIQRTGNLLYSVNISNAASTNAAAGFTAINNIGTFGGMFNTSDGYTSNGVLIPNTLCIFSTGSNSNLSIAVQSTGVFSIGTGSTPTEKLRLFNNGNLKIGSIFTDSGQKLQIEGAARIDGLLTSYGADFFVAQSAGVGIDYFHVDDNPNISAGANNQVISLLRLRDRGSNGAFTGVRRFGVLMENNAGGNYPFQINSETGNTLIGVAAATTTTTKLTIRGGGNSNATQGLSITNAGAGSVFQTYDSGRIDACVTGGNFLLGTSTDTGQKLQVNGTSVFNSLITFNANINLGANVIFGTVGAAGTLYDGATGHIVFQSTQTSEALSRFRIRTGTTSTDRLQVLGNGNVIIQSGGTFTDSGDRLQVTGSQVNTDTRTYATGSIQSLRLVKNLTIPNGATISSGNSLLTLVTTGNTIFQGSVSVPNSTILSSCYLANIYRMNAAATITSGQATGLRSISQLNLQNYFDGTNSGTYTHVSSMQISGYYNNVSGVITPTITNAYQLLINEINDFGHTFTFTNKWGIYQEGTTDRNYLAGNLMLGTTTDTGQKIQINGTIRIDGQLSGTAGGNSGQHLIVNCDGTTYKIKLENV